MYEKKLNGKNIMKSCATPKLSLILYMCYTKNDRDNYCGSILISLRVNLCNLNDNQKQEGISRTFSCLLLPICEKSAGNTHVSDRYNQKTFYKVNQPEGELWMLKLHAKREQRFKFPLTIYSQLHCPPLVIKTGGLMLDSSSQGQNRKPKRPNIKLFKIFGCDT